MSAAQAALVEALAEYFAASDKALSEVLAAAGLKPGESVSFRVGPSYSDALAKYETVKTCYRAALAQAEAAQSVAVPQGWKLRTYFDDDAAWLEISGPAGRCGLRASRWRSDGTDEGVSETIASRVLCKFGDALAAAPQPAEAAPKQEAVSRFYCNKCGYFGNAGPSHTRPHDSATCNYFASAVAAQPQQPAPEPVARVPLTEKQMLDCVRSVGTPAPMGLTRDRGPYEVTEPTWFLIQLVRAVERAHGIAAPQTPAPGDTEAAHGSVQP